MHGRGSVAPRAARTRRCRREASGSTGPTADPASAPGPARSAKAGCRVPSARMATNTDLPPHVRAIVDEPGGAEALIEGAGPHEGNGKVEAAVHQILTEIGEDPERQGLVGTPERVHRMYTELTAGDHVDP